MVLLKVLLFLAALSVYANNVPTTYTIGWGYRDTIKLVEKHATITKMTNVTFNTDKKYELIIDKVTVSCDVAGVAAKSQILNRPHAFAGMTVRVGDGEVTTASVEVAFYGRWVCQGNHAEIEAEDVVFA